MERGGKNTQKEFIKQKCTEALGMLVWWLTTLYPSLASRIDSTLIKIYKDNSESGSKSETPLNPLA